MGSNAYPHGHPGGSTPEGPQAGWPPYGHPVHPQAHGQPYPQQAYGQPYPQQAYGQPYPQQAGAPAPSTPGYVAGAAPSGFARPKNRVVAGLLALFLGSWGVHNFYLGYNRKAAWQLGLNIFGYVTLILFFGLFVLAGVAIWAFVEAIMIFASSGAYLTDADGVPLD